MVKVETSFFNTSITYDMDLQRVFPKKGSDSLTLNLQCYCAKDATSHLVNCCNKLVLSRLDAIGLKRFSIENYYSQSATLRAEVKIHRVKPSKSLIKSQMQSKWNCITSQSSTACRALKLKRHLFKFVCSRARGSGIIYITSNHTHSHSHVSNSESMAS